MGITRLSAFLLLLVAGVMTSPADDKITSLPGLTKSINFDQYSGYLETGTGKMLHYWLVKSQKSPSKDPLVVWLNGGPGCSSLGGLLEENGPFRIDSTGKTLITNPHSWNKIANVLYIEAPAGVGFSYSNARDYTTTDDQTADDNLSALKDFYKKFPEYDGREFFLTGESYAGIYVPTLASRVIDDPTFNFKGFAVGNGLSDRTLNNNSMAYFAYYHGLISSRMWDDMVKYCCPGDDVNRCPFTETARKNDTCYYMFTSVYLMMWGSGLNPYNLYSECAGGIAVQRDLPASFSASSIGHHPLPMPVRIKAQQARSKGSDDSDASVPPCSNSAPTIAYLNRPDVRKALHIPDTVKYWSSCSFDVSMSYIATYDNVYKEYVKAMKKGVRILVYNGDVDMACNFIGDEWFVNSLPLKGSKGHRAWNYVDESGSTQVAGHVEEFDELTFVTIRGSGHFVPTDRPIPAFDMFYRFINDEPYHEGI